MNTEDDTSLASQYLSDAAVLAAAQALLQSNDNSEDEDVENDVKFEEHVDDVVDRNGAGLSLLCEVACGRIVEPSVTLQNLGVTSPVLTQPAVTSPTSTPTETYSSLICPSVTLQIPAVTSPTVMSTVTPTVTPTVTIQTELSSVSLMCTSVTPAIAICPTVILQQPCTTQDRLQITDVVQKPEFSQKSRTSNSIDHLIHELQPRVENNNIPSTQSVQNLASNYPNETISPNPRLNQQDTASILLYKHSSVPFASVASAPITSASIPLPAKRPLKPKNKSQPRCRRDVSGFKIQTNKTSPLLEDAVAEIPKLRRKVRLDYSKLDGPDEDEGDLSDYIRHRHQPPPGDPVSSISSKRRKIGGDIITLTESIIASPHLDESERKLYQWYRDLKTSRISLTYDMLYNMTKGRFPDCANQAWLLSFIDKFGIEFN